MTKEEFKQARLTMGLSQTELALKLGWTSKRNIVNIEKGHKELQLQTELAIKYLLLIK